MSGGAYLTPRETEVVQLFANGCTRSQVAGYLCVTPATVKSHLEHARTRLNARNTTGLVAVAWRKGLIQ